MIYVMLPAYNEEKGIPEVLSALEKISASASEPFRIVVVDDGSKDRTSEIATSFSKRLDLKLFKFEQNQGVTGVFNTGLRFVTEDSRDPQKDICVVLDSDNTQDPKLILEMAKKIKQGEDIVIASRFEGEGRMIGCPWTRQIFSYGVSWMMRVLAGMPTVKDYSTFYRAYRISVLQAGFERYGDRLIEGKGFASICSFLLKLGNVTNHISEVPLILRYDFKQGASGNKIMKTIRGYLDLMRDYTASDKYRKMERLPAASSVPAKAS